MDRLVQFMENLNIDSDRKLNDLVDTLRAFDLEARQGESMDLTDDSVNELIDDSANDTDNSINDLCDQFRNITFADDGAYLEHVTGKVFFIGQCGLDHKKSLTNDVPKWVITN